MCYYVQVVNQVDGEYLKSKLGDVVPGVIRGYSHSESGVRKASVFCLVAIHAVVGDSMREHLQKLSSSQASNLTYVHTFQHLCIMMIEWTLIVQTKLLDLYIKRHQQEAAKAGASAR